MNPDLENEMNPIYEQRIENFEGTKNVTIANDGSSISNNTSGNMGDVQAGIEFIYHMREHIVDVGVATVYLLVVYAIVLWLKKKFK